MRAFKFIFLALGICLIMAYFIIPSTQGQDILAGKAGKSAQGLPFEGKGPDYVLGKEDSIKKAIEEEPVTEKSQPIIRTIVIPKGADSYKVAKLLFEKGLIQDRNAFDKRLIELGLDRRIPYGTHNIQEGLVMDDIIKIITGIDDGI